jgi:hypothetical protein
MELVSLSISELFSQLVTCTPVWSTQFLNLNHFILSERVNKICHMNKSTARHSTGTVISSIKLINSTDITAKSRRAFLPSLLLSIYHMEKYYRKILMKSTFHVNYT